MNLAQGHQALLLETGRDVEHEQALVRAHRQAAGIRRIAGAGCVGQFPQQFAGAQIENLGGATIAHAFHGEVAGTNAHHNCGCVAQQLALARVAVAPLLVRHHKSAPSPPVQSGFRRTGVDGLVLLVSHHQPVAFVLPLQATIPIAHRVALEVGLEGDHFEAGRAVNGLHAMSSVVSHVPNSDAGRFGVHVNAVAPQANLGQLLTGERRVALQFVQRSPHNAATIRRPGQFLAAALRNRPVPGKQ